MKSGSEPGTETVVEKRSGGLGKWRALHTWSSAIVLVQLFLWIVSGLGFTAVSRRNLKGEVEARNDPRPGLVLAEPCVALDRLPALLAGRVPEPACVLSVETRVAPRTGGPVHKVTVDGLDAPVVVDARSGQVLGPLSAEAATALARADFVGDGTVTGVEWITEPYQKGYDYFGQLPAWRVNFSNWKGTRLYVSPLTGEILARRNVHKTLFDFWWTVHMFGYVDREIAWNVPILVFGLLTLVAFVSGLPLFLPWLRRLRRARAPAPVTPVAAPCGAGVEALHLATVKGTDPT